MECPVCQVCVSADKTATGAYVDITYKQGLVFNTLKIYGNQ